MTEKWTKCASLVVALLVLTAVAAVAGEELAQPLAISPVPVFAVVDSSPDPEDPDLNPYMKGEGRIDAFYRQKNKIVIGDRLLKLAKRVSYASVPPSVVSKSHFKVGKRAGYCQNAEGEITILYLLR